MSDYRNFVQDFPGRCATLLEELHLPASRLDHEVTLLIALGGMGLIVPLERLRGDTRWAHPSGDRERYEEAARLYRELKDQPFLASQVWPSGGSRSWRVGRVDDIRVGPPDAWPGLLQAEPLSADATVGFVLVHLRNALTHANVFTRGNPIRQLILLAHDRGGAFRFLVVSPRDLRELLVNWFEFLRGIELLEVPFRADADVA